MDVFFFSKFVRIFKNRIQNTTVHPYEKYRVRGSCSPYFRRKNATHVLVPYATQVCGRPLRVGNRRGAKTEKSYLRIIYQKKKHKNIACPMSKLRQRPTRRGGEKFF